MIRTILIIATAACCATVLGLPAAAAEKPKVASDDLPKPCDVYGPGYKPLGAGSDVCIKIGVSVQFVARASSGGHSSVADTSDWIKTKPAGAGN